MGAVDTSQLIPEMGGSIDSIRVEIDDAFKDMATFLQREPDEIMRMASGHSARLSWVRVQCLRIEDWYRPARDLRTRELEPCIEELQKQWAHGSRLHSVRELDWKIESGER
ncbi:MAG: hypothetical protein HOV97_05150 [Nonomuraea sp.]|nr:hypothetical protein [Nonomuraea sp.]